MNRISLLHASKAPLKLLHRSSLYHLTWIALLVVAIRLALFVSYPEHGPYFKYSEPDGWLTIARHVVNGDGYIWPAYDAPTARRGPTVVLFFAAVIWLFGDHEWTIFGVQCLVDVSTAILLYILALQIFNHRRIALVAAFLFAGYGSGLVYTMRAWSEPLFTFLLVAFSLYLLSVLRQPALWRTALCGLFLGVVVLARPVMQFYPAVLLVFFIYFWGRAWRQIASHIFVLCAALALFLSPWAIRNYLVFNAFIPTSSHRGDPFHQSNYMLGESNYFRYRNVEVQWLALRQTLVEHFGEAPNAPDRRSYVRALGLNEHQVDQVAFQAGLEAVRNHPGRYLKLSAVRFLRLWFGNRFISLFTNRGRIMGYFIALANGTLLALAMATFVRPPMWAPGGWMYRAIPLVVLIAYNVAVYTLTIGLGRYTVPIMPHVMLLAAATLVRFLLASIGFVDGI